MFSRSILHTPQAFNSSLALRVTRLFLLGIRGFFFVFFSFSALLALKDVSQPANVVLNWHLDVLRLGLQ
jgi:hypothetical protein